MMTTQAFIYHQRHRVILLDTSGEYFERRYRQVYTKDLTAHRGTDNQILIQFVNQDQKRVDVTGKTFTCRLISHTGHDLLLEKTLESVNEEQGQVKLVLTESELDLIAPGKVGFSIEQTADNTLYEPVYVDDNAGGRGIINVTDSIMPAFVQSDTLTIPEGQPGPELVTSILSTEDVDLFTFQLDMDQFVGDILVEGATDTDSLWYEIQTENITIASDLHIFNVEGYHPYLRLTITPTSGSVETIKYR